MSMIVYGPPGEQSWYSRGWQDYEDHSGLREGLDVLQQNGECRRVRCEWTRGWRDALIVDLCDTNTAPKWMKEEMGIA